MLVRGARWAAVDDPSTLQYSSLVPYHTLPEASCCCLGAPLARSPTASGALQSLQSFKLSCATRVLRLLVAEGFYVAPNQRAPPPRSWVFCDTRAPAAGVSYRGRPYPIAEDLPPEPLSALLKTCAARIARDQHEFTAAEGV